MRKTILIILLTATAVLAVFLFFRKQTAEVCFNDSCFRVEIADNAVKIQLGLMFRKEVNEGMLFIFSKEGVYPFWMKNTYVSLDIFWINAQKEVVFISRNAEPKNKQLINPGIKAKYVLEFKADTISLTEGDVIEIN